MGGVIAGLSLGVLLALSAAIKAVDANGTRAALATYGLTRPRTAHATWIGLVLLESAVALGLFAGLTAAAWAAAAMFGLFTVAQMRALARGRAGRPCACFGARGKLGPASLVRSAALSGLAVAAALLPRREMATQEWLSLGLVVALVAIAVLAVVVLALAREIGQLKLAVGPQGALEVPHEGPEIGARTPLAEHFAGRLDGERIGLAVFTSEGCGMCRSLTPVVEAFGRSPHVSLQTFDEVVDAGAWAGADVPGSPYAVALDSDGSVLAKGAFNTGAQLESVLATAERRRAERSYDGPEEALR